MASGSKTAVVAAVGGNTVVMIAKFIGFFATGSGAMLSEAIHTFADVLNQVLLLIGITRSDRDPDDRYMYGYGQERFVWALISAVGIFFLGCGVTVYHGVHSLLHLEDSHLGDLNWAFAVLIFALVVEGIVFYIAFRGLKREAADEPFIPYLRQKADPSAVAVLLEDAAACTGVIIALVCILLTQLTGEHYWDAIGSILIGILLGLVAVWLIVRNTRLLVLEAVPEEVLDEIREIASRHEVIAELIKIKSKVIDMETYDVCLQVDFNGEFLAEQTKTDLKSRYEVIEDFEDFEDFAKRYAEEVMQALGKHIDVIEREIQDEVPKIKFIDIEADR